MYKIYKDNNVIATTARPVWVRKHPTNECYIPAEAHEATGIAVQSLGVVYALMGRELAGMDGEPLAQVVVVEGDGGADIDEINGTTDAMLDAGKSDDKKYLGRIYRRAVEIIFGRLTQFNNAERLQVIEIHEGWSAAVQYQSGQYVKHGRNDGDGAYSGRPVLYRARSNVSAGRAAPDVNTNDWERTPGQ